jgi:hypothetical protein
MKNELEVGDEVWVKGTVIKMDKSEVPYCVEFNRCEEIWMHEDTHIRKASPTPAVPDRQMLRLDVAKHLSSDVPTVTTTDLWAKCVMSRADALIAEWERTNQND